MSIVKEQATVSLEWMAYLEAQTAQSSKFSCSWETAVLFVLRAADLCSSEMYYFPG